MDMTIARSLVKSVDFIGRPRYMGDRLFIAVPKDFEKDFKSIIGKWIKFHGEEILEK